MRKQETLDVGVNRIMCVEGHELEWNQGCYSHNLWIARWLPQAVDALFFFFFFVDIASVKNSNKIKAKRQTAHCCRLIKTLQTKWGTPAFNVTRVHYRFCNDACTDVQAVKTEVALRASTREQIIFDFLMSSQEGEASLYASVLRRRGKKK